MANETTTTTTDDSSDSGILVAKSDYQAAIRAIEETFLQEELRRREKAAEDSVIIGERGELSFQLQDDTEHDLLADKFCTSVKDSLIQSLSRIVQATQNDQEFHDIVDPYHIVEEEDEENEEDDGEGDKTTPDEFNDDEEDEEEEEFSESELLDIQAWQEAQKLRGRVRDLSGRVQQIRERTLNRTREALLSSSSSEDVLSEGVVGVEESEATTTLRNEEFDASVKRLMEIVHHPKWSKMVDEMKKFQDTISVVQNEQDRSLSQVDAAIISRSNSTSDEDDAKLRNDLHAFLSQQETEDDDENEEILTMSPNDRLVAFFQQLQ